MSFSSLFFSTSPILRFVIRDSSMKPTLKSGSAVIVVKFLPIYKRDIIVFKRGKKHFIKRVSKISNNTYFVVGDNVKDSLDSRTFGWVEKHDIIGKVVVKL